MDANDWFGVFCLCIFSNSVFSLIVPHYSNEAAIEDWKGSVMTKQEVKEKLSKMRKAAVNRHINNRKLRGGYGTKRPQVLAEREQNAIETVEEIEQEFIEEVAE